MALGDVGLAIVGKTIPDVPDQIQAVFGAHPVNPQFLDRWRHGLPHDRLNLFRPYAHSTDPIVIRNFRSPHSFPPVTRPTVCRTPAPRTGRPSRSIEPNF